MKLFFSICLFALLGFNCITGYAQKEVEISGVKYIMHTVTKSETVFSLCKKYQVTQKEILQANPGLSAILQNGTTVKIPVARTVATAPQKVEVTKPAVVEEEFYYHKVNKKQTIFSIARQYGITANDLIRNNPELSNGLVIGQIVKVPVSIANVKDDSVAPSLQAENKLETESDYSVHPVVAGETLYSLEQRYEISHEEMLKYNPTLQNGLKTGMKLKIPVKKATSAQATGTGKPSFARYQVEKGETLFSLAARFGVEVNELKKANPSLLSRSLEAGETIMIPQNIAPVAQVAGEEKITSAQIEEVSGTGNCTPVAGRNTQKFRAGLLLPLHLPGNDQVNPATLDKALLLSKIRLSSQPLISADTTTVVNGTNIDQKAVGFLEFYEGALLAIDSLQRKGMNIELYVFDVSNQQMINALLQLEEFRNLNLIIGPVYPELQEAVASFAAKNRIPMVSPLSQSGNFEHNNSYYIKVNPHKEYQIERTANYIAEELADKNIVLLELSGNSSSAEAKLAALTKEKLAGRAKKNLFHQYNFQKQGVSGVKPMLDETGENIFIIPTDNEAQVSVAVTNLNALAEHYNIVLMGTPALTKLRSIPTENFHRIRLRYISPYFVDYNNPLVRRFVGQYRETFAAEPSQFSFQGFDVSYYFLSALYIYGRDFRNCLPEYPMQLTQMSFNLKKVAPMGGLENQGLFITSYERNFDVMNFGIVGESQPDQNK
jgi:LysM repeat protein/ABC-type branched-subunit amino acid transport system substrate-binding protein